MYNPKSYRKFLSATLSVATVATVVAPIQSHAAESNNFSDVSQNAYYATAVNKLIAAGAINGYPDNTFKPDQNVTRAEATKILALTLDNSLENAGTASFTDLTEDWYKSAVTVLANKGIINGEGEGTFAPNKDITRAEMAKLLVTAYELKADSTKTLPFTDVVNSKWYADDVKALFDNGVTQGTTDTTFSPDAPVTRAQAAAFIYRAEQLATDLTLDTDYATQFGAKATMSESYLGNGSWQAVPGQKMELYIDPTKVDELGSFTVSDIDNITYMTKTNDAKSQLDFGLEIYTDGTENGWYGERLSAEPMYAVNRDVNAGSWNEWRTSGAKNELVFYDSNHGSAGIPNGPTLSDIQSGPVEWSDFGGQRGAINYADKTVKYIKLQTGSNFGDFNGFLDKIKINLKDGRSAVIDLEASVNPTGVTVADNDTVEPWVDGRDIDVHWTATSWKDAATESIYVLPAGTSLNVATQKPVTTLADPTAESWAGSRDVKTDSIGATLGQVPYDVYVVAFNKDGSKYEASAKATFTPSEEHPIVLSSDAATASSAQATTDVSYLDNGAWQAAKGQKMELYLDPTQNAAALGSFKVSDIKEISYVTKDTNADSTDDFGLEIYTEGTDHGWYGQRLSAEPMYAINAKANADGWNTWSTSNGDNELVFYDSNNGPAGIPNGPTLADIQSDNVDWSKFTSTTATDIDYADQTVKYIKIQTGSQMTDFDGYLDEIRVVLKNGKSAVFDLEK